MVFFLKITTGSGKIMNLIEKIKKIPGGITWRAERYWKEYILKLPLHTRRFFVLRTRALKEKRQLLTARGKYGHLYKKDDNWNDR